MEGLLTSGGARVQLYVAVHELELHVVPLAELPRDAIRHRHRPVAASGATDRDGQVLLSLDDVGREQEGEQRHQPAVELAGLGARLDVLAYRLVEAGQRPQVVDVVRVWQKANV